MTVRLHGRESRSLSSINESSFLGGWFSQQYKARSSISAMKKKILHQPNCVPVIGVSIKMFLVPTL